MAFDCLRSFESKAFGRDACVDSRALALVLLNASQIHIGIKIRHVGNRIERSLLRNSGSPDGILQSPD